MLVNYMIEKYIEDTLKTLDTVVDKEEIKQLTVLERLLTNNRYVINAMIYEFDINKAPNKVLLFDTERCMFWKQSQYGYTDSINDAGLFDLNEAKDIVQRDYCKNTKIVWI